jgi:hypothetical protein
MRAILVISAPIAVVTSLATFGPLASGLGLMLVLGWFVLPGLVLAYRMYGPMPGGWAATWLAGPAWGYVLSSLVLLAFWAAGARSVFWLITAPIPAMLLVWPARSVASHFTMPVITRREIAAWAFVTLAVVAIVGRPFSQVGRELPEGRAYRAYFTADFVWAMAIVSEVSKGAIPPQNPYYVNDPLHYYWLVHLLPAVEHRAAPNAFTIEHLLLANALWTAVAFGGFFYFFVRHFVDRPWAAALACVGVLFCSSFEGIERLIWMWLRSVPLGYLRTVNIDAVGNWFHQGMKIDGLHRLLLYQPQHQLGYVLGFSALLVLVQARDCSRRGVLFFCGAFLGMSLLLSSFATGVFGIMVAIYAAIRLTQSRQWKAAIPGSLLAALPIAAAVAISVALEYVDPVNGGKPPLDFGLNPVAATSVATSMFLNFGPVAIVAGAGLAIGWRHDKLRRVVPLSIALIVSLLFYFFVDVPDVQFVYVGFHVGKLIFIALAPLCGIALQEMWSRPGWVRWCGTGLAALIALAALPTVIIDLYNTQDISNRRMGPGFRWTVILGREELEGLDWIKRETPQAARVQVEPDVRRRDTWAYVPAFAERRMVGGVPLGLVPLAKYDEVSARIKKEIYESTSAQDAYEGSRDLCIDYLVIGQPERTAYTTLEPLLDQSPHLFTPKFRNHVLTIYAVLPEHDRPGCPR